MSFKQFLCVSATFTATAFALSANANSQQTYSNGAPVQQQQFQQGQPAQFQQGQPYQQRPMAPQPQYYNITLTEQQKAQPSVGADFQDARGGVAVRSIYTNSPAKNAGLNTGDIILTANGQPVGNAGSLNALIVGTNTGETIKFTKRTVSGKESQVECKVMTMNDIVMASIVPDVGVFDQAVQQTQQLLSRMEQEINNSESELEDLKKRYTAQQERLAELKTKAEDARVQSEQRKAAEAAKRQQQIEAMKKAAEEAAKGG